VSQNSLIIHDRLYRTLRLCLTQAQGAIPFDYAGVWIKGNRDLWVYDMTQSEDRLPPTAGLPVTSLFNDDGAPVLILDTPFEKGYQGELGPISSLAIAPMQADRFAGTVALASSKAGAFSAAQLALLSHLAGQMSILAYEIHAYSDLQTRYAELADSYQSTSDAASQHLRSVKQLQQANEDLGTKLTQTVALVKIGQSIHMLHDETKISQFVAQALIAEMSLERGLILLLDDSGEKLSCRAHASQAGLEAANWFMLADGGLIGDILRRNEPAFVADAMNDTRLEEGFWSHFPVTSLIAHPLIMRDEPQGVLVAGSQFPYNKLEEQDIDAISILATQTGQALENAWLYNELRDINTTLEHRVERRTRELGAVNQISETVNSTLELQQVLDLVMDQLSQSFAVERASILLMNDTSSQLAFAMNLGGDLKELQTFPLQLGKGIAGWVALTGETAIVNDPESDPRFFPDVSKSLGFEVTSLLCVPLATKGRILGVVELLNKIDGDFVQEDATRLLSIIPPIAIAIENAQLYGESRQQSAERLALVRVGQELRSLRTLVGSAADISERLLEVINQASPRYQTALLYTREEESWILQATHGLAVGEHTPARTAYVTQVGSESEKAVLITNLAEEPGYKALTPEARSAAIIPLKNWHGETVSVLNIESQDILEENSIDLLEAFTEQIAAALDNVALLTEIEKANCDLVDLNDARIEFVSSVSHELRTPMTSIKGYTDMLLSGMTGEMTEPQRRFLSIIQSNADRLGILVNDLLEVSRLEAGRIQLKPDLMAIDEAIFETTTSLQGQMVSKNLSFESAIPATLPPVWGDKSRIIQVLVNLVSNAVKYTTEGGSVTVRVTEHAATDKEPAYIQVDVVDTGIGIAADEHDKVFQRFFRADHDFVREQVGTGLGLSIVRGLVELHGGRIWFTSELGEGSTFSFTLPLASPKQLGAGQENL
jgi:signal transduction histidine kinase/transcriptional regulator with GAF, ATPase, and Fis domain